jgi:zinc protease
MMFKGTPEVGPGELSEIIARNGGEENAFTAQDYTAYFERIAADRLEVALRLEADRMMNLTLAPEEFDKERQVVMEERRLRVEDDPRSRAQEVLRSVAYDAHGYGHPVIGWMADLEDMQVSDLEEWYKRHYGPANARLVVVGDVAPERVFALAREHFGDLPARAEVPPVNPGPEPMLGGDRQVDLTADARVPYLVAGYRVPNLPAADKDWEPFALRLAAGILDEGRSARLPARLVRGRGLAASAGTYYSPEGRAPGLFYLEAIPADTSLADLQQALEAEIAELRSEAPSEAELDRVKRQIAASEVFSRDSIFYQATQIGKLETIGYGHEYKDRYLERIRAVTPEQVRQAAAKYLVPQRRTLVRLHPAGKETAE